MTAKRPDPKRRPAKSDVLQAALQVEAYESTPEGDPALLAYADDADGVSAAAVEVAKGADSDRRGGAEYDEHDWDDVVQQTFPASDAPPPPGGG